MLIPIYLAQYDFDFLDESHSVTLVLEAFSRSVSDLPINLRVTRVFLMLLVP